jgi:hypothetical protein
MRLSDKENAMRSFPVSMLAIVAAGLTALSTVASAQAPAAPPAGAADKPPEFATPQTTPAKFSAENDAKDKQPLAVQTFTFTPEQKQAILQSIGTARAESKPATATSGAKPEPQPGTVLADIYEMRELPANVLEQTPALRGYKLVTVGERAFVVSPANRIVVAEITR